LSYKKQVASLIFYVVGYKFNMSAIAGLFEMKK
jgi:hypothetical protein